MRRKREAELNAYLAEHMQSVRAWLQHGHCDALVLLVTDAARHPVERFVFSLSLHDATAQLDASHLAALEKQLSAGACVAFLTPPFNEASCMRDVKKKKVRTTFV